MVSVSSFNQAVSAYNTAVKNATNLASSPSGETEKVRGASFNDLLSEGLGKAVNNAYKTESLSTGAIANKTQLNDLVTAVTATELALDTVVAVRDRVIAAYQDIVKMPI